MKRRILPIFAVSALLLSSQSYAQKNTAFAVTASEKGNFNWNVIREIDLSTGEVLRTLYDPAVNKAINLKHMHGTELKTTGTPLSATGSGVAAAAFDAVHNRLYFTGMRADGLSYFDLSSSELNVVVNDNPAFNTGNKSNEANVITRMAFASDGYGYAITNDGKGFIRFTTDPKPTITNLGELIDGSKNGTISIHAQCSSWGGDMVGDAYGNLYLVTYRNHIFKINPTTRIADYLGAIKGVSAQFTSNGAVVDNDGELIVSSATMADNYYRVNISTLEATPLHKKEAQLFNASDLANSNLLYQRKGIDNLVFNEIRGNSVVSVFPNPAVDRTFNMQFDKIPSGKYNLVLTDASGRTVVSKALTISVKGQVEKVSLPRTSGGGLYLVKLTGGDSKAVYSDKVVVVE
jgi:hypothetical protein